MVTWFCKGIPDTCVCLMALYQRSDSEQLDAFRMYVLWERER